MLKAGNGKEVILSSERYKTKASVQNGIASIQNHLDDSRYHCLEAINSNLYFDLKMANQITGATLSYRKDVKKSYA